MQTCILHSYLPTIFKGIAVKVLDQFELQKIFWSTPGALSSKLFIVNRVSNKTEYQIYTFELSLISKDFKSPSFYWEDHHQLLKLLYALLLNCPIHYTEYLLINAMYDMVLPKLCLLLYVEQRKWYLNCAENIF